jgi:prepilin-type N-terminal cleavage/methylation domain-containing protein
MTYRSQGFTIVEVIIVVIVTGILVSLGILAFTQVQTNVRNDQRAADIAVIAEGLEEYYRANGVYPSCTTMTQSIATVASLLGIPKESLTAPTAASGTNSISCSLLTAGSGADNYAYVGDLTSACTAGTYCLEFTLQYRQEGTGTIITKESIKCGEVGTNTPTCYRPAG